MTVLHQSGNEGLPGAEQQDADTGKRRSGRGRGPANRSTLSSGQVALRLGLAFGLLVVLMVIVGDQGLRRMDQINSDLQDMMSQQWTKVRISREALALSNRNSRITMQVFLLRNRAQIDALLVSRAANSAQIAVLLAELDSRCKSEEEKQRLAHINDQRKRYLDSYLRALNLLVHEQKYEAAADVMVEQASPELLKYQSAWDDFVRFEGDELERAARESRARNMNARSLALLSTMIAVLLGAAVAMVVTKRMMNEVAANLGDERETLRLAYQEAEVFINAVPSILIGLNRQSEVTRWNSSASGVFRLPNTKVVGKPLIDCGIHWLRPDMPDEIRAWLSGGEARRCDQVPFELNGESRLLGLTITPVHVTDQDMTKLLVIGSDITDRTNLEAQLRQAQKLESVGQLAAGIAHEINTPTQYIGDNIRFLKDAFHDLGGLVANCQQTLAAAPDNNQSRKQVEKVSATLKSADTQFLLEEIPKAIEQSLEGVGRVAALVNAMKEFSHPGTKDKIHLDLNHAIQSTITVARNEWKYVADVVTDFDPSLPMVSCLAGEFNQVILNLIVNAAHTIADVVKGGAFEKGTITVQTRNSGEWVEIRIQDNGAGIPEKVRPRIFDPFFTTKEIGKGTGQGLAIARSVIVDKHQGTIQFETELGKGTTFIIRLPHIGKSFTAEAGSA
jgi:signal transduction histidine kinase